jgi:superoxide dismutase, Cu-Zn family
MRYAVAGAAAVLALALALGGRGLNAAESMGGMAGMQHADAFAGVTKAVAVLHSPDPADAKVSGIIRFEQTGEKVHVTGEIKGLAANSQHGFHVHEFGDVSASAGDKYDGLNLGGHYNPEGASHQHAGLDSATRHAGDLGNVTADANGTAYIDISVDNISLAGAKNPILGRGLVLHANPDDLKTQPTGNAGGRIAVAVIGVGK